MDHHGKSNYELVVTNVGNSWAVICCKKGVAKQLSVDHENQRHTELLKVTRSFGIKGLQPFISCEPYVAVDMIDNETEFLVLASHPLWEELMSNQYVVNSIRQIENTQEAAEHLTQLAFNMRIYQPYNDISCVVVRFR